MAALLIIVSMCPTWADEEFRPVVIVYTGGETELAEMLADLIAADDRIDSEIKIVDTPAALAVATVLPTTECIVIYSDHRDEMKELGPGLTNFIQDGGGLVGMTEACYEPSAGVLATDVFPVFANTSVIKRSPTEKRVRTYVLNEATEIASGLPESFELLSMGLYFRGDEDGNYLDPGGDYTVVYKDLEIGSPLVLAYENQSGGRSVALPGIMVVRQSRVDVYYGNLIADENFVKLFTSCVYWAAKGSQRYPRVSEGLEQKIEDAEERYEKAGEAAREARRKKETQRLLVIGAIWGVGLVACGVILKKVVLVRAELEA